MFSYHHHIGDFRRDTASLSDTDAMAYLKLLWMYYDTESPLPADPKLLAFKIGANPESVQMILNAFFTLDGDVYRQKRCDAEIAEYYARSDRARAKAEARWKNASASNNDAIAMLQHSSSNATATKSHANREPRTDNKEDIDRFEKFWKKYPRKIAKPNAKKAWLRIKPDDALTQKMIDAIDKQGLYGREIQFVPHPATWLNGERWEDEVQRQKSSESAMPEWAKGRVAI